MKTLPRFRWMLTSCILVLVSFVVNAAQHPNSVEHRFTYVGDVGFGNSVFLVGDAAILGEGASEQGVKLRYTPGNVWEAVVRMPPTIEAIDYSFVRRSTDPGVYCSRSNERLLQAGQFVPQQEPVSAPYQGKTIHYYSSWERVYLVYRFGDTGDFQQIELQMSGPGREVGENLFQLRDLGAAGERFEFVLTNGHGDWDNAFATPGQNYETELDFIFLQDGHIYNYVPASSVSQSTIETRFVDSSVGGIVGRNVRILLPRGYASHPDRHYPVLYLHDGQNVFSPGGVFGSWDVDLALSVAIQMGRARECIVVAIDNTADRLAEYLAPTDNFNGTGRCDDYAEFVIDHVRPTIDTHYRTLSGAENTLLMGSSFGGIATVYMGWAHPEVFGKLGALSPSWWAIPNLRDAMRGQVGRSQRVFLYWGTEESSVSADASTWWPPFLDGYDLFLSQGYVVGGNFLSNVGCGLAHNEAAWASQMPEALEYLLDIRDERNELADFAVTKRLNVELSSSEEVVLDAVLLAGENLVLQTSEDLNADEPWQTLEAIRTELYWESLQWTFTKDVADRSRFYRLVAEE